MNNTWCRIAVCVFFYMASSASAALSQEMDFVLVSLEQLRDRLERDDKGMLDEFVADVSAASGSSEAASRDSLVSLLRNLKTHCKKSTALGEQLFALHGEHFSEREAKAYLVRVVDMAGDLLKKDENVGLEPLIAKAASKSKLLKFQALDYTKALLVSFVGSPVVEELAEAESAVKVPTGTFKVLVRTRNSEDLSDQVDRLVENGSSNNVTFSRVFKVSARPKMKAEKKYSHCTSRCNRPSWMSSSNGSTASASPRIPRPRTFATPWITLYTRTGVASMASILADVC